MLENFVRLMRRLRKETDQVLLKRTKWAQEQVQAQRHSLKDSTEELRRALWNDGGHNPFSIEIRARRDAVRRQRRRGSPKRDVLCEEFRHPAGPPDREVGHTSLRSEKTSANDLVSKEENFPLAKLNTLESNPQGAHRRGRGIRKDNAWWSEYNQTNHDVRLLHILRGKWI